LKLKEERKGGKDPKQAASTGEASEGARQRSHTKRHAQRQGGGRYSTYGSAEALDILCGGGSGLDSGEEKVDIRGWTVVKR